MSDIKLVNVIPIVSGWKDASQKTKAEAQTLMASGNPLDYISGCIKDTAGDLIAGMAVDLLKAPGIDPKSLRPVAHWDPVDPDSDIEFKCSKCEFIMSTNWDGYDDFNYCPCCGAKMEGRDE